MLPGRQEPAHCDLVDRLDLVPERGQGAAAEAPQHLGVAPLAAGAVRPELALKEAAGPGQPPEGDERHGRTEPEARGHVGESERAVGAGVPADQVAERVRHRLGEHGRDPLRQGDAEGVAKPGGVFDGRPPLLPGETDRDDAPGVEKHLQALGGAR